MVTPAGVGNWDVGIVGEQIVAVAFPGILPDTAKQVIDARGKIVVPGGIETHAHAVANVQPGARPGGWVPNAGPLEPLWGPSGAARRRWSILRLCPRRATWPRGSTTI